jgi:hypothetical protein
MCKILSSPSSIRTEAGKKTYEKEAKIMTRTTMERLTDISETFGCAAIIGLCLGLQVLFLMLALAS